jgi:hypothetical protein
MISSVTPAAHSLIVTAHAKFRAPRSRSWT